MRPSFWLVATLVFGWIMLGLFTRRGELVAMVLPLLAYLLAAIWLAPDHLQFSAVRRLSTDRVTEGTPVDARLTLINQGALVEELRLVDELPEGVQFQDGRLTHLGLFSSGVSLELEYCLIAGRGRYSLDGLQATGMDPFGLFSVTDHIPAKADLLVYPQVSDLTTIPIHPPYTKGFSGPIPSRKSGTGTNFHGVREYQQGDPLRWINWRMSARHVQSLFTNEFEQERIADVGLILDARQQVNFPVGNQQVFDHAVLATASLATVFLEDGHCVSLVTFGAGVGRVFPGYGKVQREHILRALANVRTGFNFALENLGNLPARLLSPHAQLVYISPLSASDLRPLLRFKIQGYEVLVVSPDPIRFELMGESDLNAPDLQLAERFSRLERGLLLKNLRRAGVQVIDWDVTTPLSKALEGVRLHLPLRYRSIRVLR